jgi:hypothetical protein
MTTLVSGYFFPQTNTIYGHGGNMENGIYNFCEDLDVDVVLGRFFLEG